jgi:hypothetical protein
MGPDHAKEATMYVSRDPRSPPVQAGHHQDESPVGRGSGFGTRGGGGAEVVLGARRHDGARRQEECRMRRIASCSGSKRLDGVGGGGGGRESSLVVAAVTVLRGVAVAVQAAAAIRVRICQPIEAHNPLSHIHTET